MTFQVGVSGNPAGRPRGTVSNRTKIAERLIADIREVWEACGIDVLKRLAADDPAALAKIAYGLIPRELQASLTVQAQATPAGLPPSTSSITTCSGHGFKSSKPAIRNT